MCRLNIIGLGAFSGPLGIQLEKINFGVLSPKASGLLSARVAVQARVQREYIYIYSLSSRSLDFESKCN